MRASAQAHRRDGGDDTDTARPRGRRELFADSHLMAGVTPGTLTRQRRRQ